MQSNGRFLVQTYIRRYGSWKATVETAGHEYRGHPSGPDAPGWTGGYGDISYGPNWYRQWKRALNRDNLQCQHPICTIDRSEHEERFNRDLTVHHIMPLRKYVGSNGVLDYERAN